MKIFTLLVMVAALGLLLPGCGQPEDRTTDTPALNDGVDQDVSGAADETGEFMGITRDEFIAAKDEQLANLKQNLNELESDASVASEELKNDLQNLIDQASVKLEELKKSGEENWEVASQELREDLNLIQERIEEIRADNRS